MSKDYPNPWNFSNTDDNLISPNGKYRIEFGPLWEIGMGAPISGESFLIFDDKRIKLYGGTGGPVIWNETSDKIAMPIWTERRFQKIAIVDITDMSITTFKETFNVLHFSKFENGVLYGIDGPVYTKGKLVFDINKEEIDKIKYLNVN